jgi:hypothetical protein
MAMSKLYSGELASEREACAAIRSFYRRNWPRWMIKKLTFGPAAKVIGAVSRTVIYNSTFRLSLQFAGLVPGFTLRHLFGSTN